MILTETHELHLQKTYDKVESVSIAYDDTVAFLARRSSGKDVFVHSTKQGKILHETVFDDLTTQFALISDYEAIIYQTRKNAIQILNLKTYKSTFKPFNFLS